MWVLDYQTVESKQKHINYYTWLNSLLIFSEAK